jgi:hypothetical protein
MQQTRSAAQDRVDMDVSQPPGEPNPMSIRPRLQSRPGFRNNPSCHISAPAPISSHLPPLVYDLVGSGYYSHG